MTATGIHCESCGDKANQKHQCTFCYCHKLVKYEPLYIDSKITKLKESLLKRRSLMKTYLQLKVDEEDFHGVQDAASDLRDIDSGLEALERIGK